MRFTRLTTCASAYRSMAAAAAQSTEQRSAQGWTFWRSRTARHVLGGRKVRAAGFARESARAASWAGFAACGSPWMLAPAPWAGQTSR